MATPHVAGCAALVKSLSPLFTGPTIRSILQTTAVDLGSPGYDTSFGWGRLDCGAAVDDHITLLVRDDGQGIDAPPSGDTAGVSGMRERALLIGAQLKIRSHHGAGTEVQLDVPLH